MERGPYDALILPAPFTHLSTPTVPGATWISGGERRGEGQGANAHPTTQTLSSAPRPLLYYMPGRGLGGLSAPYPNPTPPANVPFPPSVARADGQCGPCGYGLGRGSSELSRPEPFASGVAVYNPPPHPPPPLFLHRPARDFPGHPCQRTFGNLVIAQGWDLGRSPPCLLPCARDKLRMQKRFGVRNPTPKMGCDIVGPLSSAKNMTRKY